MGAWSFSPSPMTTTPRMLTVPMSARIASTAAPSPPFLSPRPTHRPAAMAAASVTRTSSRARLRSGAGRSGENPGAAREGPSGTGSDTGPPGWTTCGGVSPGDRPLAAGPGRQEAARTLGGGVGELSCDPRGMSGVRPSSSRPLGPENAVAEGGDAGPAPSPAVERANRFNYANMLRSLVPLVVICLAVVGWNAFRQNGVDPVREVDSATTVQLAAARAGYPVLAPAGLSKDYRPTSARTDAGNAAPGGPVTLEIGYLTPSEQFAAFVESDDPKAAPLRTVLDGAQEQGTEEVGGQTWTRSTTQRGETALSRVVGQVTVVVSGSATDDELRTVAAAVQPYSG